MKYFVIPVIMGSIWGLLGLTPVHREPPCKCEVTVYKRKRKGIMPCIVSILRDSATQKPAMLSCVVINNTVSWANDKGRTYADVMPNKQYTLVAKCFTYYFCTQKVIAHENDSIVCVFNMRRSREPIY